MKLNATIPLKSAEAKAFKQQWQTGLVRPEAKAKFNGDLIEVALLNDADNSRLINNAGRFMTRIAIVESLAGVMIPIPGKNYEMGKYDVTQAQWEVIMGSNPSSGQLFNSDSYPADTVSWDDVQEFIQKLNTKTGRQYRLPNEEEWEYACYGGNKTEYCGGNDLNSVAWYAGNGKYTMPVGQKRANGYGLYDMSGNVWQWMQNVYDSSHPQNGRAARGGASGDTEDYLRATSRSHWLPTEKGSNIGFRLARTLQ